MSAKFRLCLVLSLLSSVSAVFAQDPPAAGKGDAKAGDAAPAEAPTTKKGLGRGGPALSEVDVAEIAPLKDLPPWKVGLPNGEYSTGPEYPPSPEQTERDDVPKGKIIKFKMDSAESKIFPGQNAPFQRDVAVYIPAQNKPDSPAPFIVACDQYGLQNYKLSTILDNMIADKRLPPLVAVMIANAGPDRSYEYDTVWGKNAEFVENEVLPRVEKEAGIKLTKDPEARMTLGGSSGGICAFSMAWFHPELYHRVLSYSGTFVNLRRNDEYPHGGWEYPENLISKSDKKPLRVWLHAGEKDNGATAPPVPCATGSSPTNAWPKRSMRKATPTNLSTLKTAATRLATRSATRSPAPSNSSGAGIQLKERNKSGERSAETFLHQPAERPGQRPSSIGARHSLRATVQCPATLATFSELMNIPVGLPQLFAQMTYVCSAASKLRQ